MEILMKKLILLAVLLPSLVFGFPDPYPCEGSVFNCVVNCNDYPEVCRSQLNSCEQNLKYAKVTEDYLLSIYWKYFYKTQRLAKKLRKIKKQLAN